LSLPHKSKNQRHEEGIMRRWTQENKMLEGTKRTRECRGPGEEKGRGLGIGIEEKERELATAGFAYHTTHCR
jgi:hypothetical protein